MPLKTVLPYLLMHYSLSLVDHAKMVKAAEKAETQHTIALNNMRKEINKNYKKIDCVIELKMFETRDEER